MKGKDLPVVNEQKYVRHTVLSPVMTFLGKNVHVGSSQTSDTCKFTFTLIWKRIEYKTITNKNEHYIKSACRFSLVSVSCLPCSTSV